MHPPILGLGHPPLSMAQILSAVVIPVGDIALQPLGSISVQREKHTY